MDKDFSDWVIRKLPVDLLEELRVAFDRETHNDRITSATQIFIDAINDLFGAEAANSVFIAIHANPDQHKPTTIWPMAHDEKELFNELDKNGLKNIIKNQK